MKIQVACVQTAPILYEKTRNIEGMCRYVEHVMAAAPDTKLIVFPELATTGYECGDAFADLAEDIDDPDSQSIQSMRAWAKACKVHLVYGFAEKAKVHGGRDCLYNAQILIDDTGEVVGVYRKVHLFDSEKKWFTPGDAYDVFETKIGRLGLFICYDASFPEVARILALQGADILINSTNWENPSIIDMEICMTARAFENTTFLICCNRVGQDEKLSFFGHSRILDPLGKVIVKQDEEIEDILIGELDFEQMAYVRDHYYTMLKERRPDTYGLILKEL